MEENYTYEEVLQLDQLSELSPEEYCRIVGLLIDTGLDRREVSGVEKGIYFAELPVVEGFEAYWRGVLYYYKANGWATLQKVLHPTGPGLQFSLESKEHEQEIGCLRKALSLVENYNNPSLLAQILTNLGNAMNHVGRFVEAIEYWNWALHFVPDFGMAVGNLGFGLFHYAKVLYDEGHRLLFCKFAYYYLLKGAAAVDVYADAKNGFIETAKILTDRYGHDNLVAEMNLDSFSLGDSKPEQAYRKWCMEHNLFLNPLNDIVLANIVSHDCFFLPGMTAKLDDPPVYHAIYNQLKQEYASARYLLYEGITQQQPHFSDKGNLQMDTLDYAVYSLNSEKIKIAFRICYSIFDKIAYLLNDYLEVGLPSHQVNFKRVWYKKGNQKPAELNPLLLDSQNWALRGLYWLSKDLLSTEAEPANGILPEAQKLVAIRNFMIVDIGTTQGVHDEMTMQITRTDLVKHTLTLMRMARAAMMYISFAIHIEEQKKVKGITVPFYMPTMPEEYKT